MRGQIPQSRADPERNSELLPWGPEADTDGLCSRFATAERSLAVGLYGMFSVLSIDGTMLCVSHNVRASI